MINKVLAWDDDPEQYFDSLRRHLLDRGISMVIKKEAEEFWEAFRRDHWDFVITDILEEDRPAFGEYAPTGKEIAKRAAETHPVFVVTHLQSTGEIRDLKLPNDVLVKTKETPPSFMAMEIIRDLRQRGLLPGSESVYLIGGESDESRQFGRDLQTFLISKCQLDSVVTAGDDLEDGNLRSVQRKMRACAAVLAICGQDVEVEGDGKRGPGPLTQQQLGLAAGLANGLPRLTLIQKWGASSSERSHLTPSLSRVPSLQFKESVEEIYEPLIKRLLELQVQINLRA